MFNLGRWLGFGAKSRDQAGESRVRFLVITADGHFHSLLHDIATASEWTILRVPTVEEALALLRRECVPLVIYDWDGPDSDWRDALDRLTALRPESCTMLASKVADEYLQREVVRHHGYDVLPRSGNREQLMRALQFAWFWQTHSRMQPPARPTKKDRSYT
jgi:DNA-binding response OmpR family regulator